MDSPNYHEIGRRNVRMHKEIVTKPACPSNSEAGLSAPCRPNLPPIHVSAVAAERAGYDLMHYGEYKRSDPSLVKDVVETFPFATIMVNGPDGPIVAQAPITFRAGAGAAGAIEFHLATANPIASHLAPGVPVTVMAHGPGAHVSPTWFIETFADAGAERNRTAPTYNYLSLVMAGRLEHMDDRALQAQIADLVLANEGTDGWRLEELALDLWDSWRGVIQLYRLEIERFDLTAKLSPGDTDGDRPGVVAGLRRRGIQDDHAMAILVERSDDSSQSLATALNVLRSSLAAADASSASAR